jgi:hypothetical protein
VGCLIIALESNNVKCQSLHSSIVALTPAVVGLYGLFNDVFSRSSTLVTARQTDSDCNNPEEGSSHETQPKVPLLSGHTAIGMSGVTAREQHMYRALQVPGPIRVKLSDYSLDRP